MANNSLPQGFQLDQPAPEEASSDAPQLPQGFQLDEEKYGGIGSQIAAGLEGVAQGVAGPLAPAAEEALGVPGADIRGRAAANPVTHAVSQGLGLAGSTLVPGLGEASLAGQVANVGEHVAGLLPEATGVLGTLASTGVKTGAEMAALQTSDELSKMITQDPNQSLGSAAINVGLAGIIGGAGGAVLGSVSPLWNKAANKLPVLQTMRDMLGEMKFWDDAGVTPLEGATKDVNDRIQATQNLMYGGMKSDLVGALTKDVAPENMAAHAEAVDKILQSADPALQDSPTFQRASTQLKEAITPTVDPITLETSYPDPSTVFQATDNFKRAMQKMAEPSYAPPIFQANLAPDARAAIYGARDMAAMIRPTLEDSGVWGAAGQAQKAINAKMSPMFDLIPDFMKTVAGKEAGEGVADPGKLETLLNQTEKGKGAAILKTNKVQNLLKGTDDLAETIQEQYANAGLEPPPESVLNDTPYLNRIFDTPQTTGVKLAQWLRRNGAAALAGEAGHVGGGGVGAGLGWIVGHPMIGAYIGDRLLKPIFSGLAKPFAENAINSEGVKSSIDYVANVARGQKALSDSISNFFKAGAQVVGKDLIPDQASRDKLEKSLEYAQNPNNLLNVAGSLGHYLPTHAMVASQAASNAANYFAQLKPKQPQGAPLDSQLPIDKAKQATYERQLNIAQQPLLVLQHAKNGTILPQDIQTLQTIYPGLQKQMASKLGQEMIEAKSAGTLIPYKTRLGMSQLVGYPIDSTMTPQAAQAVLATSGGAQSEVQQQGKRAQRKPSSTAITQINKTNALYETALQRAQFEKRTES